MTHKLTAIIEREGDGYVSLCPELDIASQGNTVEQARENLKEALELFFETASPTCDIAPNLSGIREVDDARIEELFLSVMNVVDEALKPGGNFVIKSFSTTVQKIITESLKTRFTKVSQHKPPASRAVSSEIFFVCMGKTRD